MCPSGMSTAQVRPARAANAAADAEVLPVEAQTTALAPSSAALEIATVIPRSLNEPVGLDPSTFKNALAPTRADSLGAGSRGVPPSSNVTTGVASDTGRNSRYSSITPRQAAAGRSLILRLLRRLSWRSPPASPRRWRPEPRSSRSYHPPGMHGSERSAGPSQRDPPAPWIGWKRCGPRTPCRRCPARPDDLPRRWSDNRPNEARPPGEGARAAAPVPGRWSYPTSFGWRRSDPRPRRWQWASHRLLGRRASAPRPTPLR